MEIISNNIMVFHPRNFLLQDEWSFEVYVDGKLLSSLTGTPVMSSSTKLILHVFNRDSYVADLQDPFNPPAATAILKNLRSVKQFRSGSFIN